MNNKREEERCEIMALCQELEDLGGGIQTRLEKISLLQLTRSNNNLLTQPDGSILTPQITHSFINDNIVKFLQLNLNTTLITYGEQGSGKTHLLFDLLIDIMNTLLEQFDAHFLIEAYEYYIDSKSKTEKRQQLLKSSKSAKPPADCVAPRVVKIKNIS